MHSHDLLSIVQCSPYQIYYRHPSISGGWGYSVLARMYNVGVLHWSFTSQTRYFQRIKKVEGGVFRQIVNQNLVTKLDIWEIMGVEILVSNLCHLQF